MVTFSFPLSTTTTPVARAAISGSWPVRMPISPSVVRATTKSAWPDHTTASGATMSTWKLIYTPAVCMLLALAITSSAPPTM